MATTPDLLSTSASLANQLVTATAKVPETDPDTSDQDLLDEAQDRFRSCLNWENKFRQQAEMEINFVDHLEHWDEKMKLERAGQPCLTFDRISGPIDIITNDARQNPPEPRFNPVGGGADKFTGEFLEGLYRNISNDSQGGVAIETGYTWAVKIGRGWIGVLVDYESDDMASSAFEQKIVLRRIANPFSVYPDPGADKFDGSDMRYAFVTEDIDKDLFADLYPDAQTAGMWNFQGVGDDVRQEWFPNGSVRVAEYWYVREEQEQIHLLQSGEVVTTDKLFGAVPVQTRTRMKKRVFMAKMTGLEVLERYEWMGTWIPLVPIIGRESVKEGKRTYQGMIRRAMDANLSYDFMRSKEAQVIGLAPIAPILVASGAIEGFEAKWADSNRKPYAFLEYRTEVDGKPVPIPTRTPFTPEVGAITGAIANADRDLNDVLVSYPSTRGEPSNETSGKAIGLRQQAGDNAHFHFRDNLNWAVIRLGQIVADLVPKVYSESRMMHILNPDGSSRELLINAPTALRGRSVIYQANNEDARYHVTIGSGQSFASMRDEGKAVLVELAQTNPLIIQKAGDLYFKALGIPYGDEIAARFAPPGTQDGDDPEAQFQQLQQTVQQQNQIIPRLTQALHAAVDENNREAMKLASQERRNTESNQAGIIEAALKAKSAEAIAQMQTELQHLHKRMDALLAMDLHTTPEAAPEPGPEPGPEPAAQ